MVYMYLKSLANGGVTCVAFIWLGVLWSGFSVMNIQLCRKKGETVLLPLFPYVVLRLFYDAALGVFNERDDVVYFFCLGHLVFYLLQSIAYVQSALVYNPVGIMYLFYCLV